jgi:hypothetical protein
MVVKYHGQNRYQRSPDRCFNLDTFLAMTEQVPSLVNEQPHDEVALIVKKCLNVIPPCRATYILNIQGLGIRQCKLAHGNEQPKAV